MEEKAKFHVTNYKFSAWYV